jgi:hypothetical protein
MSFRKGLESAAIQGDLKTAACYALVCAVEALERIADRLDMWNGDGFLDVKTWEGS